MCCAATTLYLAVTSVAPLEERVGGRRHDGGRSHSSLCRGWIDKEGKCRQPLHFPSGCESDNRKMALLIIILRFPQIQFKGILKCEILIYCFRIHFDTRRVFIKDFESSSSCLSPKKLNFVYSFFDDYYPPHLIM